MGIEPMFSYESYGDMKKSDIYALYIVQGGISLPSTEYYILDTFEELRKQYKEHIKKMFLLTGNDQENSRHMAEIVFNIETKLAKSSFTPVELRDPEKNYHKYMLRELKEKFPGLELNRYLNELEVKNTDYIIIGQPNFFHNLEDMIREIPLDEWKVYVAWKDEFKRNEKNDAANYILEMNSQNNETWDGF